MRLLQSDDPVTVASAAANGGSSLSNMSSSSYRNGSTSSSSVCAAVLPSPSMTTSGNGGSISPPSPVDDDDDTEKEGDPPLPDLLWQDGEMQAQLLVNLNHMRRNKHFCDVILQVGKQDFFAHRAVLAAASPYLMDLFNDEKAKPTRKEVEAASGIVYQLHESFQKEALEILIEYAYTARLDVPSSQVKSVYLSAVRLRMERAVRQCAEFLAQNLDLRTCLELRALPGVARRKDIVHDVDAFIDRNIEALLRGAMPGDSDGEVGGVGSGVRNGDGSSNGSSSGVGLASVDRVCVEVLHGSREELELAQSRSLSQLVLDWIHGQWLEDERLTLEAIKDKKHLLFLDKDNSLEDCQAIEEGSPHDSEIIQDYKKTNMHQHQSKQAKKVRRHSAMKPAKPRELLYSRHINQEDLKTEDHVDDWKVISCATLEGGSILALITIDGNLFACSIIQRVNRPNSPCFATGEVAIPGVAPADGEHRRKHSNSKSPSLSRPPSQDKDVYAPVASMAQAKCGAGTGCLQGKLIVCGGFDRGECLNTTYFYDPSSNSWSEMEPMLEKRGRFDLTVSGGRVYAVAGSSGQMETNTAERFDSQDGKWRYIASLPAPISSMGVCSLDGVIYGIGGTYGQSGNKHCYRLVEEDSRWERIANLNVGRSQAAVASFQGKIWAVGGCDAWNPLSSVEVYDPSSNSWRFGPPLNSARRGCGLADRGDGLLHVVGGSDGTQSLCTTEVLDPRVNLWAAGPNLTACRVNVSCTVADGKLWAVGGFSGKMFLNTIEYLDLQRDEWTTYVSTDKEEEVRQQSDEEEANKEEEAGRPDTP